MGLRKGAFFLAKCEVLKLRLPYKGKRFRPQSLVPKSGIALPDERRYGSDDVEQYEQRNDEQPILKQRVNTN